MKYRTLIAAVALSFILGTHNGYIALWKDGVSQPVRIFPYKTEMLPKMDQAALEKGIRIRDSGQLSDFLEDYLS